MRKAIGIWVDHRKAILVSLEAGAAIIRHLESDIEPHVHSSGGSGGTAGVQSITKERAADERRKHQRHDFYQEIIKALGATSVVYILGPGEAKNELIKEIEKMKGLHLTISAVETCDKLTEPQLVAKIKTFFKG
jgi:stalled ribosome rescue protein Dom34